MRAKWILVALVVTVAQTHAADRGGLRVNERASASYQLNAQGPYPVSWRAAKIRRADPCWRTCLADAGREFQRCLRVETATDCVPWNDANDRACLRECRLSGGPLVNLPE